MQGNLQADVTRACLSLARASRRDDGAQSVADLYASQEYDWRLVDLAVLNRGEAMELTGGR